MKKTGFTLAEVLITLAIIGVVATMTLPALMNNTQEQQARTGLKKVINTLTHAAEINEANIGFNYMDFSAASDSAHLDAETAEGKSIAGLLATNASVDLSNTGTDGRDNFMVTFRDGTSVSFPKAATARTNAALTPQADGLPLGIAALVDINGAKGPNVLSNCQGLTAPMGQTGAATTDATLRQGDTECTKQNKVIKDRFGVRLRGVYVAPNGHAARYAFEK